MKKKNLLIIIGLLAIYTTAIILGFIFIPTENGNSNKDMWSRSYSYIDYTEAEKAAIYDSIGLDITTLTANDFPTYKENFMTLRDWAKELRYIELFFENIYCTVKILYHSDEVSWEREEDIYTPVELIGLQFGYSNETLKYDDTQKEIIYVFSCSESLDSETYQCFLRVFFGRDESQNV